MYDIPQQHLKAQVHHTLAYKPSILKNLLASLITFPPEPASEAYKDLVCTEKDQAIIFEILTTIEENGKLALLLKKSHLQALGSQINHVHPLKFLSTSTGRREGHEKALA